MSTFRTWSNYNVKHAFYVTTELQKSKQTRVVKMRKEKRPQIDIIGIDKKNFLALVFHAMAFLRLQRMLHVSTVAGRKYYAISQIETKFYASFDDCQYRQYQQKRRLITPSSISRKGEKLSWQLKNSLYWLSIKRMWSIAKQSKVPRCCFIHKTMIFVLVRGIF